MRILQHTLTLALFLCISLPSFVSAQSLSWGSVTSLSSAGVDGTAPIFALSSDGSKATAVWESTVGANSILKTASATINGNSVQWGPTVDLATAASPRTVAGPGIALSSNGTEAVAIWHEYEQAADNRINDIVRTASATINGNVASWGDVTDLSAIGQDTEFIWIAMSSDGAKATAVWDQSGIVQTANGTISQGAANWSAVTNVSAEGSTCSPSSFALSSDGTKAAVAWRHNGPDTANVAVASINGNTASWSSPIIVSPNDLYPLYPELALSSDGTLATVVWSVEKEGSDVIQARSATISGNVASWGSVMDISPAGVDASKPKCALSADGGHAITAWEVSDGVNTVVQAALATVSGNDASWGSPINLSASLDGTGAASLPQVAFAAGGIKVLAGWAGNRKIQAASATVSESTINWSSPDDVSIAGDGPYGISIGAVKLSSAGNLGAAAWGRMSEGLYRIEFAAANDPLYVPPTPTSTATPSATSTLVPTATSTVTPTMTATMTPTATPTRPKGCYSLNLSVKPADSGSIGARPAPNCRRVYYRAKTRVTLTAKARSGHRFLKWSGAATSTRKSVRVVVTRNVSIRAKFR